MYLISHFKIMLQIHVLWPTANLKPKVFNVNYSKHTTVLTSSIQKMVLQINKGLSINDVTNMGEGGKPRSDQK